MKGDGVFNLALLFNRWCSMEQTLKLMNVPTLVINFHICICRSCSQNKGSLGILRDCYLPYFHEQMKCHNEICCSNNPQCLWKETCMFPVSLERENSKGKSFQVSGLTVQKCEERGGKRKSTPCWRQRFNFKAKVDKELIKLDFLKCIPGITLQGTFPNFCDSLWALLPCAW